MCVWPYILLACFQFQVFSNSGKRILYLAIKDNWVIGRCWGLILLSPGLQTVILVCFTYLPGFPHSHPLDLKKVKDDSDLEST